MSIKERGACAPPPHGDGFIITGKGPILFAQLLARRGALRLECAGMRRSSGVSVAQVCRLSYGIHKAKRVDVLSEVNHMVERAKTAQALVEYAQSMVQA